MDPEIIVKPAPHQVDDLHGEIRERAKRNERVLVTTLTKRMSEDLTKYYEGLGVRVKYLTRTSVQSSGWTLSATSGWGRLTSLSA